MFEKILEIFYANNKVREMNKITTSKLIIHSLYQEQRRLNNQKFDNKKLKKD